MGLGWLELVVAVAALLVLVGLAGRGNVVVMPWSRGE